MAVKVVGYAIDKETADRAAEKDVVRAYPLDELVQKLKIPRGFG